MSQKLFFSPPNAPIIEGASLESILVRITQADVRFWSKGPATLWIGKAGGGAPSLLLLFTKEFGYYVEVSFTEVVGKKQAMVAYIPDAELNRNEMATVSSGQNNLYIPRDFCLSPERCADVVTTFCLQSKLAPNCDWIKKRESGWNFLREGA